MPGRARQSETVIFKDFEWFCERTQVSVVVHAQELHELYKAMAECNGVPLERLLANSSYGAGEKLRCYQCNRLPSTNGALCLILLAT